MRSRQVLLALALLVPATGCRRILSLVLDRAQQQSPPPATPTPPQPTAGGGGGGAAPAPPEGSSVETPAPSRASGCPATTAFAQLPPGTRHRNVVERDEVWTLEDSPHHLPNGLEVHNGATLTLAPCAVVLVGSGHGIWLQDGAGIMAVGTQPQPVRIGSDNPQPQPGDYRGLFLSAQTRRTSRLAYLTIEHAGQDWDGPGAGLITAMPGLDIQNVTLRANRAFGLAVREAGSFSPGSAGVTVTGTVSGESAHTGSVFVSNAPSVGTLPLGQYAGNALDEVFIEHATQYDGQAIRTTSTWRNLGVPYHLSDNADLRVEGPTGPVLTIAPGTVMRMGRGSLVSVGFESEGGLVVDGGDEAHRVQFIPSGNDTSPGQWNGIYFGARYNRTGSRMRFVTLRNAGSGNEGMCHWEGGSTHAFVHIAAAPLPTLLDHVAFVGAPPDAAAIARNWSGAAVDFAAPALGNDFSQLGAACHQSPVKDANGNCPEGENARCQ